MSGLYQEPVGYQDPDDDDRPRKWVKQKPDPSIEPSWSWSHTGIKPPSGKVIKQTPPQSPPKNLTHPPVSSGVRKKVAELASSQPSASSPPQKPNIQEPAITGNEKHIANQLLLLSDMDELYSACSDSSGAKFQSLIAPQIKRLCEFTQGETINPEHVLFLLRTTLRITIPK